MGDVEGTPLMIISKGAQTGDGSAPLFPFLPAPPVSAIATMKLRLGWGGPTAAGEALALDFSCDSDYTVFSFMAAT